MSAAMALRLWQTGRVGKSMSGRASCPSAAIIICQ